MNPYPYQYGELGRHHLQIGRYYRKGMDLGPGGFSMITILWGPTGRMF